MSTTLPHIFLARHGETAWTLSGQHTGRTDLALTPNGEAEARKLGPRLQGLQVAHVFSSPLKRAWHTAELAGFGERCETEPDLMEWNYGNYEGRKTKEIRGERPDWKLFRDGCPGGESPADIGTRIDRLIAKLRGLTGDVLLFGHGHCFRVLAARWLGLPPSDGRLFRLSTAALSILSYEHSLDEPVIQLWNDVGQV